MTTESKQPQDAERAAGGFPAASLTLDARGKYCPVPILELARAIQRVGAGEVVEVVATDPGVESDLPAWCKATRNEYLGLQREGGLLRGYVRRRLHA